MKRRNCFRDGDQQRSEALATIAGEVALPVVANVSKRWELALQRSEALPTIVGELLVPVRGWLTLEESGTLAIPVTPPPPLTEGEQQGH